VIAVVHEFLLAPAQKDTLVRLLRSSRAERPTAIVARLLVRRRDGARHRPLGEQGRPRPLPRDRRAVTEMLPTLGAQASPRIVEVAEYG
jgi:hypothetical protein